MSDTTFQLNDVESKKLVNRAVALLRMFHQEYEQNPVSRDTEFQHGKVTGFRQTLVMIVGEKHASAIVDAASREAGLTVPHDGTMTRDGKGYEGWDSGAHTYIGKLDD
jgi:hypothetical protein